MEYVAYQIEHHRDSVSVTRKRDKKTITVPMEQWEYLRTEVCFTELKTIIHVFQQP